MNDKSQIRGKLETESTWITSTDPTAPTDVFSSDVDEDQMRYIVLVYVPGQMSESVTIELLQKEEDGSYSTKFCPIPVAPADTKQLPEGSYSIEDPVVVLEGGTNLSGAVDVTGSSLNVTVNYWDHEV